MGRRPRTPRNAEIASKVEEFMSKLHALDGELKKTFDSVCAELMAYSIFRLREIAISIPGVASPTTKSKEDLVKHMAAVMVCNMRFVPPNTYDVAPVSNEEAAELMDDYLMRTHVVNPENSEGILSIRSDGAWLQKGLRFNKYTDHYVPFYPVNKLDLRNGDFLTGRSRFLAKASRWGMYFLSTINGAPADGFSRPVPLAAKKSTTQIKLSGSSPLKALNIVSPIYYGQRKMIIGYNAINFEPFALELSHAIAKQGFETVSIMLDNSPENANMSFPGKSLIMECTEKNDYDESVMLAIDYAKTRAASGQKVALILNAAESLSENVLREFFGAARASNEGNLTVIAMSSAIELTPLVNRISGCADSIAVFKRASSVPHIDLTQSFSDPQPNQAVIDLCRQRLMNERFVSCDDLLTLFDIYKR